LLLGGLIIAFYIIKPAGKLLPQVRSSLVLSILLFGVGGLLGYRIAGANTGIPAHYHGSIVAMTLGFMGLLYHLMESFGIGALKGKLVRSQPYIYAFGQLAHVLGLAWMGGYGALRKAAGSTPDIHTTGGKILFFSGGAVALVGGLLFVILVIRAMVRKK